MRSAKDIASFDFPAGRSITPKYEVIERLGSGWEGEVYKIIERNTGIIRAAKLFYPKRNLKGKTSRFYARKLHTLRHCPIVIQYHTEETVLVRKTPVTALISEFVEGELLSQVLARQPGKRMHPFMATHLLYALTLGIEQIHHAGEYHGDLHSENVIVSRHGLGFELKLLDLYHWNAPKRENLQEDLCDMIRLFYDALGGAKHYAKQTPPIKYIVCGLKRGLILKRFRNASQLREHLETMRW